jgi:hypothetical protein
MASTYKNIKFNELGKVWKEAIVTYFKFLYRICLEGLRKTTENLSKGIIYI